MAYLEPGVVVTQQFVGALPALATFALPNVTVGPVFQVVDKADSGNYAGVLVAASYGDQMAGTYVDTRTDVSDSLTAFPVRIFLDNAIADFLDATTGVVLVSNLNVFTDATVDIFEDVVAGDQIVVNSGALTGTYTVRSKINNNTLRINETFAAADTAIDYSIVRNVGEVEISTDEVGVVVSSTSVTLPAGLEAPVGTLGDFPIVSADILLSYRALRIDKSANVWEYGSTSELQADFGLDQIRPENPAVFGAYLALNNAVTKTNILGLGQAFLTDELLAYSNAFEILALIDMYAISVMTQNTAVHTALKSHAEGMSVPTKKLERVGIVNRTLVTKMTVVDTKADGVVAGAVLTSATSEFITDGVVPGMFIVIGDNRYEISAVDSQTQVTLASNPTPGSGISFLVERDLQKSEQASVMAAYARSLGSRRMVLTYPDVIKVPVGNEIKQLPGYFLNCSIGALTTGLPTQQGFTNLSVAVYSGVVHSTKYFDGEQLNTIADGGVMIFVQDVLDETALYIRHQLTTDRSAIKFQEYSVTKNVDFIAKFIRENQTQFIGQYNIVDSTLDDIKTSATGIIKYLTEATKLPKIGGVIKSGSIDKVEVDSVNIDRVNEVLSLDIPIPLNGIDVTLVV
jgi:hypothetical protein